MTEISGQAAWLAMGAPEVSELDEIALELWRAHQRSGTSHLVEGRRYVLTLDEKGATVLMPLYDAAELAVRRAS